MSFLTLLSAIPLKSSSVWEPHVLLLPPTVQSGQQWGEEGGREIFSKKKRGGGCSGSRAATNPHLNHARKGCQHCDQPCTEYTSAARITQKYCVINKPPSSLSLQAGHPIRIPQRPSGEANISVWVHKICTSTCTAVEPVRLSW